MPEAVPDPDPQTIAARCQEVQAGWSEAQRLARKTCGPNSWLPPILSANLFAGREYLEENHQDAAARV